MMVFSALGMDERESMSPLARLWLFAVRRVPSPVKRRLLGWPALEARLSAYYANFGEQEVEVPPWTLRMRLDMGFSEHRNYATTRYEKHVIQAFVDYVHKGATVVDVGAYIGYFTIHLASLVGPAGRVLAFEPLQQNVDAIEANLRLNGFHNATIVPSAVSDEEGHLEMSLSVDKLTGRPSASSSPVRHIGAQSASIRTVVLDDELLRLHIGRVDLVKLDVEGMELKALRGMRRCLGRDRPVLVIECNDDPTTHDVKAFLTEIGYHLKPLGRTDYASHYLGTSG